MVSEGICDIKKSQTDGELAGEPYLLYRFSYEVRRDSAQAHTDRLCDYVGSGWDGGDRSEVPKPDEGTSIRESVQRVGRGPWRRDRTGAAPYKDCIIRECDRDEDRRAHGVRLEGRGIGHRHIGAHEVRAPPQLLIQL